MYIPIRNFSRFLTPNLYRIVDALKEYDYETRIVGGAVRDLLMKRQPRDIDLATTALPDEIMYLLEKHDLKYTTRGIMHGTVKVIFPDDEEYEITTRDYSIHDRSQRLSIHHEDNWIADAKRRDFTFNSLMMDLNGEIFDYVGGIDDLKQNRIRMYGDADQRIMENPYLLIRFFKALAYFPEPKITRELAHAVENNMSMVRDLDQGWIDKQISTFRKYPNGKNSLELFQKWSSQNITEANENGGEDMTKRKKVALFKKYGGQVLPFSQLPQPYQLSIAHYMAVDGEIWDAPHVTDRRTAPKQLLKDLPALIKKHGNNKFLFGEIPTEVVVSAIKGIYPDYGFSDMKGARFGEKHPKTNRWPAIVSGYSDEFLQDGNHRFSYYRSRGDKTIPLIMYV